MSTEPDNYAVIGLRRAWIMDGMNLNVFTQLVSDVMEREIRAGRSSGLPEIMAKAIVYNLVATPDAVGGVSFENGKFRVEPGSMNDNVALGIRFEVSLFILKEEEEYGY